MHEDRHSHRDDRSVHPRLTRQQGLDMLTGMPLGQLMRRAFDVRQRLFPGNSVTYVCDTNPNYTNICVTRCEFCAFYRRPDDSDAFTLSPEDLAQRVARAAASGATTVLLQGGHNPDIRLSDWIAYIRAIRRTCPDIHIHPFSPTEYAFMARLEKTDVRHVLQAIWDEGVHTIPGGGAEILSPRVRGLIAQRKASTDDWLRVSRCAHRIGFKTTATMMYGHVETDEEIIDHLVRLREAQDETGGFSSFIPWSFKPGHTPLAALVPQQAHPARYVRIIAVARMMLDNIAHIQSSWFSETRAAGQLGLLAGADDFGGILIEEHVLKQAGHNPKTAVEDVLDQIRAAGFQPQQRNSDYQVIDLGYGFAQDKHSSSKDRESHK